MLTDVFLVAPRGAQQDAHAGFVIGSIYPCMCYAVLPVNSKVHGCIVDINLHASLKKKQDNTWEGQQSIAGLTPCVPTHTGDRTCTPHMEMSGWDWTRQLWKLNPWLLSSLCSDLWSKQERKEAPSKCLILPFWISMVQQHRLVTLVSHYQSVTCSFFHLFYPCSSATFCSSNSEHGSRKSIYSSIHLPPEASDDGHTGEQLLFCLHLFAFWSSFQDYC